MPLTSLHPRVALAALVLSSAAFSIPSAALASPQLWALERAGVREVIVRHAVDVDAGERAALRASVDGRRVDVLRLARTEVLRVPPGELSESLAELNSRRDVVYAEPNSPVVASTQDEFWGYQWGLHNVGQGTDRFLAGRSDADIDAPEAWAAGASGQEVTVAVVDTGVDADHPDLAGQLTGNPGEIGGERSINGLDDDGNGLVDDWRGWDFVADAFDADATPGPDNLPEDPEGHGTHVLGTVVAARYNTEGVAGVAPEARVIPLRALGADGSGDLADIAEAFDYAGDLGVAVVNASLGGPNESHTLRAAIEGHPRTLFVVAAGNGGDDRAGDDVDVSPEYPCATSSANLLCVAASDNHDNAAGFSNFGRVSVDLFAPGVAIASTSPRSDAQCAMYCLSSGTSMAAPHAAGVAALVVGAHPGLRGAELKAAMLAGVDLHPHFAASVTGGRLNAAGALAAAAGWSTAPEPSSQAPRSTPPPSPVATPSPAPTAPPASPSPPPPAPGPERLDITGARLSAPALRGRRGVGLVVRTSRPATVTVQLSATGSRTAAATLRSATRSGRARFRLQRRLGAVALRSGRYQVRITARSGAATASRALVLRVA